MDSSLNNPYGYLDKNEFTSELYKIEIKNLHSKVGFSQLKQRLKSIGLNPHKVKILKDLSFVTFKSAEERDEAIKKVNGHIWKGNELFAKIAKARADPCLQKRKELEESNETSDCKKLKVVGYDLHNTDEEKLKDHVVKFWRKSYEDQLIAKEQRIKEILQNIYKKINKENTLIQLSKNYFEDLDETKIACPMLQIKKSPIETHYRNKCEFTFGMTLDKTGPIAGFCHGKYRGGVDAVGDARCLSIVPESMCRVLDHINEFLTVLINCDRFSPRLAIFTPGTDQGHLRGLTLRTSVDKSLLMIVDIHPQSLSTTEIEMIGITFVQYFTEGPAAGCGIKSILLSLRRNNSDPCDMSTTQVLYGTPFVFEHLMGLEFRVSFNAFFQVNSLGADTLYSVIKQLLVDRVLSMIDKNEPVTLLDVCCGTGTIGLAMAHLVTNVIGVEMCAESVEDAKHNATLNNIKNARFLVGKAEDLLMTILSDEVRDAAVPAGEFVAIVDPPRAGLHSNVIQALRRCHRVKHIVFVSCNPEAATSNFVEFARPLSKRTGGCPFIPEVAIPVDLFPQTPHVELVVLLSRLRPL